MLTNYPFNTNRLARLFRLIDDELHSARGYAVANELVNEINSTDLGGDWLNEHMLLDLLQRHASYELLPGGLVAQPNLGLAGWIQQRARECRARRANRNACRHKQGERRIPHAANCDVSHVVRLPENWARTMHATARNR